MVAGEAAFPVFAFTIKMIGAATFVTKSRNSFISSLWELLVRGVWMDELVPNRIEFPISQSRPAHRKARKWKTIQ